MTENERSNRNQSKRQKSRGARVLGLLKLANYKRIDAPTHANKRNNFLKKKSSFFRSPMPCMLAKYTARGMRKWIEELCLKEKGWWQN
jgi:hypothetical protein